MGLNITELLGQLDATQLAELKTALGVGKRGKKPPSPEFIAAQDALNAFKEANVDVVTEYERLKEELRSIKGVRKVLATEKYKLNTDTGEITNANAERVAVFGEDGWQSQMRAQKYTVGQIAGISKAMKAANVSPVPEIGESRGRRRKLK